MLVTGWRSDVNRNKEGETGRSECEVTKTMYLEAEELRVLWVLSWKSSFQNKLYHVVCIILTSVLRRSLLSSLPLYSGAQFRSIQLFLIAAPPSWLPHCASFIKKRFVLKGRYFWLLQNDLFSAALSKLKIVSFVYTYEPRSDRTAFPAHPCSQSWLVTLRSKQTLKKDILEDCLQGADLAER